jgi:hypothetical protein
MDLTTIFYHTDEFCKLFEKEVKVRILTSGLNKRNRKIGLELGEIMTILIYYHQSGFKTFKDFYTRSFELKPAFPTMPSYNRFVELQKKALLPLMVFAKIYGRYACNGISFIDSFSLEVSHPRRIYSHKVFRGLAERGKTSVGWFFGFKLHVIINPYGEIIDFLITAGNIADNDAKTIETLMQNIFGKVYGDKGYLLNKEMIEKLYSQGVQIITKIRKNMKNILMHLSDKLCLKKRGIVESVGAVLKEDCNIEHSRYRNPMTLFLNVCAGLMAYAFREKKPSLLAKGYTIA